MVGVAADVAGAIYLLTRSMTTICISGSSFFSRRDTEPEDTGGTLCKLYSLCLDLFSIDHYDACTLGLDLDFASALLPSFRKVYGTWSPCPGCIAVCFDRDEAFFRPTQVGEEMMSNSVDELYQNQYLWSYLFVD